ELACREESGQMVEPARLAYHYDLAGRKKPAYRYSRLAAEKARSQGSMAETLVHLDRAAELLGSSALRQERQELPEIVARRSGVHFILGHLEQDSADGRPLSRLGS